MASKHRGNQQTDVIFNIEEYPDYPGHENFTFLPSGHTQSPLTYGSDPLSRCTSGYSMVLRADINERFNQSTERPIYDNNPVGPHNYARNLRDPPYIHVPAIVSDPRKPTGNGNMMANWRLGISHVSRNTYADADAESYNQQDMNDLKRNGTWNTITKIIRIIITTVSIAGLALMLTFLAMDQRNIGELKTDIPARLDSLRSEQKKDGNVINNTLTALTRSQQEEDEKTIKLINITYQNSETMSILTANSLSLSIETNNSFKEMGKTMEALSIQTNTSINEIGNMVEESFNQIKTSSEDIANTMEALSNHTKTSSSDVKDTLKEQSNQTKTFLEDMMKNLFQDLKNELISAIEWRLGGGCRNNSLNVTTGTCVDDCAKLVDGDYQSCDTCHGYVTCANGYIFPRNCSTKPLQLIWDDVDRRCERESRTCNPSDFT